MKKIFIVFATFLAVFLLVGAGCQNDESAGSDTAATNVEQKDFSGTAAEENYSGSENDNKDSAEKQNRTVIMMGRSVMYGWFDYWGAADSGTYNKGRFTLEYHELDSPPTIAKSVDRILSRLPESKKDIVFFKFCFVDFAGEGQADGNLENNKKYIEEVYRIVVEKHGAKLIIGNALPKVIGETDIYLVWNHQQYNAWLKEFWQQHPDDVTVFNMYKQLSNDLGALDPDYAAAEDDSHLNNDGYAALDKPFWEMMGSLY